MKKILIALSLSLCLLLGLVGCSNKDEVKEEKKVEVNEKEVKEDNKEKKAEKKTVTVTTSFIYDMVKELVGDKVNRELIIPAGEDPHLYIAKPQDLEKITKADLVLYHGLHFEGKMQEVLEKKGYAIASTFAQDKIGKMEEDGEEIIDPHFWFDVDLYKEAVSNASKKLVELLPEEKENIEKNTEKYLAELTKLDEENKTELDKIAKESRYLITPHDAFNYFSRRYGIEVVAPQGVSTDSEVANKDIDKTVDFIVEHKVKAIFAESTTDPARMEKLKEACKAKGFEVKVVSGEGNELFSDSLAPEGESGDSYLAMYRHNIKLIVDNLK